jgi:hypothetical protein
MMNSRTLQILIAAFLCFAGGVLAETAPAVFSEDFESTAVGAIPAGFTKMGSVGVADDAAHSGRKSLRIEPAVKGARTITKSGPEITALGGEHWGRLYFKVKLPSPMPVPQDGKKYATIHATLVAGKATSPSANDAIEVRPLGVQLFTNGLFKFLYNVQPKARPEFATSGKIRFKFTDEWTLAEWHVDHATQTYQLFINGEPQPEVELKNGAGKFEKSEIPAIFESLTFGWNNYQPASGEGFTVWIDDIALGKQRIGDHGFSSAAK